MSEVAKGKVILDHGPYTEVRESDELEPTDELAGALLAFGEEMVLRNIEPPTQGNIKADKSIFGVIRRYEQRDAWLFSNGRKDVSGYPEGGLAVMAEREDDCTFVSLGVWQHPNHTRHDNWRHKLNGHSAGPARLTLIENDHDIGGSLPRISTDTETVIEQLRDILGSHAILNGSDIPSAAGEYVGYLNRLGTFLKSSEFSGH